MSNTATAKKLKAKALRYADMQGSDFPLKDDQDHLLDLLNDGLAELHDILVNHNGEEYLHKTFDITVVSGTAAYALPEDFFKATQIFYSVSSRRFPLERFQPAELDGYRTTPLNGGSVEMWYVPQFAPLKNNQSVVHKSIPVGWEDFAALYTARVLLTEEESDTSGVDALLNAKRGKIVALLSPRDNGEADSIADVSGRWSASSERRFNAHRFKYRIMGSQIHFTEVEWIGG